MAKIPFRYYFLIGIFAPACILLYDVLMPIRVSGKIDVIEPVRSKANIYANCIVRMKNVTPDQLAAFKASNSVSEITSGVAGVAKESCLLERQQLVQEMGKKSIDDKDGKKLLDEIDKKSSTILKFELVREMMGKWYRNKMR